MTLKFQTPFFKEFSLSVPGNVESLLSRLRDRGYHAGLPLGRWFPRYADGLTVAVTEQRTKAEIDGLATALRECL